MRCYKCGNILSGKDFCNSCGVDVRVYKKVVKLSNAYYNMGLAKAQIRDLTGACELLRRSVKIDKNNINARNLLGLVYYEMGEAVQAFCEWVISSNFQPEDNLATEYIKRFQSNTQKFENIKQTIKKYNLALGYAKQNNDDIAVIQLKKVLNSNPNLIKGHLLLTLLYMKKGDYNRAKKPIQKVLKIDSNNPLAKKYLAEIKKQTDPKTAEVPKNDTGKSGFRDYEQEQMDREMRAGYDIPVSNKSFAYKESNTGFMTVINVIIGLVIGVALTFFLLIPARQKVLNDRHNQAVLKLNSQIDSLNNEKKELQGQITGLQSEKDTISGQLDAAGNENNQAIADYDNLLNAATAFNNKDYLSSATTLKNIANNARSEAFTQLYTSIQPESFKQAAIAHYNSGRAALLAASSPESFDTAIGEFNNCFAFDYLQVDYADAADKLGEAYEKQYKAALTVSIEQAATYKERALKDLTNMINTLNANPAANGRAAQNLQAHINNITAS